MLADTEISDDGLETSFKLHWWEKQTTKATALLLSTIQLFQHINVVDKLEFHGPSQFDFDLTCFGESSWFAQHQLHIVLQVSSQGVQYHGLAKQYSLDRNCFFM